jgi:murein L,D-transpeptidase YafK
MRPLSAEMQASLEQKHMPKDSPILVRVFKEEAEFEVWKQDETGQFALLKTYPICRWSGDLGPKVKEGDRQAPEGFYTITPGQMNPNSNYYLSFNLGFPNAYDKANDRTGAFLMVHGDCSSAGCYAMTDEQMGEIYALGRESFFGGQQAFQVQAYPFRMTPANLAKHRNSPHMAFWRMIKEGYDHFEVTRQEPKVDVCDKHYVFDATSPHGGPLNFSPKGHCPAYVVAEDIAAAVKEKRDNDEREFANLVKSGAPVVASKAGADGGTNPVFAARMRPPEIFDTDGRVQTASATSNVAPSRASENEASTGAVAPKSALQPDGTPSAKPSDNPFDRMASTVSKWVGLQTDTPTPTTDPVATPPTTTTVAKPKPKPVQTPVQTPVQVQTAARTTPQTTNHSVRSVGAPEASKPPQQQQIANTQTEPLTRAATAATTPTATVTANGVGLIEGAQPVVPASSFDSRWGGMR